MIYDNNGIERLKDMVIATLFPLMKKHISHGHFFTFLSLINTLSRKRYMAHEPAGECAGVSPLLRCKRFLLAMR